MKTKSQTMMEQTIRDFSEKVLAVAQARAEIHQKELAAAVYREIAKLFPNVSSEIQKKILLDLVKDSIGEAFLFAEVSRMNTAIAEVAASYSQNTERFSHE